MALREKAVANGRLVTLRDQSFKLQAHCTATGAAAQLISARRHAKIGAGKTPRRMSANQRPFHAACASEGRPCLVGAPTASGPWLDLPCP
jgi:hypothetical protein